MTSEIDAVFTRHIESGTVHGAAFVAVNSQGEKIYNAAYGHTNNTPYSPTMTTGTMTWIASQTKLVTSVAAMQIVEKGLVGLDDDLREIIPAFKKLRVLIGIEGVELEESSMDNIASGGANSSKEESAGTPIFEEIKSPITLRMLLSHSWGSTYDLSSPLLREWSRIVGRTDNMFSGSMAGMDSPLVYQPGESWEYSPGLDWAGELIHQLSGQDLESYMQEHIWEPLGASNSTFFPDKHFSDLHPAPQVLAQMHRNSGTGKLEPGPSPWPTKPEVAFGGAGLFSTADDYSLLLACLATGGSPLLKPETLDEMLSPQLGKGSVKSLKRFCDASLAFLWKQPAGAPSSSPMEINHSLAGTVNTEDVFGRRAAGTINWAGLPGISWWLDRKSGIAATLITQVMPPNDPKVPMMLIDLETALYKAVRDGTLE